MDSFLSHICTNWFLFSCLLMLTVGQPLCLKSTTTHRVGILGLQSYAPSLLGNLILYTHFLCTLKTLSFNDEARLTSIKMAKELWLKSC